MRKDLVQKFTKLIPSFQHECMHPTVGSYVTGLYLPIYDIDKVITLPLQTGKFRMSRITNKISGI